MSEKPPVYSDMCVVLQDGQRVEIDYGCGDGQQGRVEAVEHSTVTGKDVTTVLDAEGTLEE